jgi:putative PEP-CTERM system TPR-repeat lipoprotein
MRHILACLLLIGLVACGNNESSEQYLASAREFVAEADYKAATIELKNALRLDADAAEARWLLGRVYLETGDVQSAEKELRRARDLGWPEEDVSPALAQAWLAQGETDAVLGLDYRSLPPGPAARLLASQSVAELARGNPDEARRRVALALERDPQSTAAKLAEARLLATEGDATGALIVLEEVLESAPRDVQAWRLKGDLLIQRQALEEARAAFDQSIALSPAAFGDRVKRALINLQLQDFEAAQADAAELLRVAPQHPAANYVQGLLQFQRKAYEEAITSLSVAEPIANQYPLVLFYLGSAHLIEGNVDQAALSAARFVALAPDNINGRKLLATLYLQQGKFGEARKAIQPVLDNSPDDVAALNLMANALLRDGQTEQGLDLLARIARLQPDSPVAQMRLGAGLMLSGKREEASQHLETALEFDPEFQQADILLVLNHLQKQDYEGAVEAARAYQRRNIGKAAPYNVLGRVYLAAGRTDEAREYFEGALKFAPGDPSAHLSLAQIALSAGDTQTARQHYQQVLEHHPDHLATLLRLAMLEAREQDEAAMVAWLQRAIEQHPAVLEPRLMLARYYLASGRADQVAPLFADLDELQRQSRAVLEITALAQLTGREHGIAQTSLEQLIAANPETAHYHYLLAMAASGAGDGAKARRELEEAHRLDNNHVPSRVALARLALAEQRPDEFDRHLAALVELAPESQEVLRLQAIQARRAGEPAEAVEFASRAHAARPSSQTLLELAAYQKAAGLESEADRLVRQWIDAHPDDIPARLALANDLLLANDPAGAQAQYEAVIERDPDNVTALNNLAWNLRMQDREQALAYIRRAAQAAPDRPEVLDTLAVIEHLNGENRVAYRNIERALAGAPDNPSMRYHKAMIGAALGEKEEAIALLEALLAEDGPAFAEKADAKRLLTALKG